MESGGKTSHKLLVVSSKMNDSFGETPQLIFRNVVREIRSRRGEKPRGRQVLRTE
jgi:hypothetical protein